MNRASTVTWTVLILIVGIGCQRASREVVVYTSVDQVFAEPIFREFEKKTGIRVRAVFDTEETKSTGVVNRLISEGKTPQADVFWSGDPVRPYLLTKRGLVARYLPPGAKSIPSTFRAPDGAWTGFAARARILLINTNRVRPGDEPTSVWDLVNPRWKGQTAMASPLYGTTTMHVGALAVAWGEAELHRFLELLKVNQARIASSNGEVKRLVASGEVAFGVTDTDDASEAMKDGAPVKIVFPDQSGMGTLFMPTTVSLIQGGPHPETGRQLVDFLVSPDVEERLALSAGHLPVRQGLSVPPDVQKAAAAKAMTVDYSRVADEMEKMQPWLQGWAGL